MARARVGRLLISLLLPFYIVAVQGYEITFEGNDDENKLLDFLNHGNGRELENQRSSNSLSCKNQESCVTCYQNSVLCHWCEHDQACHPRNSLNGGCLVGMTCKADGNDDDCSVHHSCDTCAVHHSCQWCGHDRKCHTIGSAHGCLVGENCDQDCKRKMPEPLTGDDKHPVFTQMTKKQLSLTIAIATGSLLLLSISLFYGFVCGTRPIVTTLIDNNSEVQDDDGSSVDSNLLIQETSTLHETMTSQNLIEEYVLNDGVQENGDGGLFLDVIDELIEIEGVSLIISENVGNGETCLNLVGNSLEEFAFENITMMGYTDVGEPTVFNNRETSQPVTRKRKLGKVSILIYIIIFLIILCATVGFIYYFPSLDPAFDICYNKIAWQALFHSLLSLKINAHFELLLSIENPNRVSVVVDNGVGIIKHKQTDIGTFNISSPVNAAKMSIIDVTVFVNVSLPQDLRVEIALDLAHQLYNNNLTFTIDANFSANLKGFSVLDRYLLELNIKDQMLNLSDTTGEDLCFCGRR